MIQVSLAKLPIGIFNVIKRFSHRLIDYINCCDFEEKKVLRQLLRSGVIDEAEYEEFCDKCSGGKLTYENMPIENEKLNKAVEKTC